MYEGHRLLPPGGSRDGRPPVGILLAVPLRQGLVVAAFARMEQPGRRRRLRLVLTIVISDRRGVRTLVGFRLSFLLHRNDKGAIGVANDVHRTDLLSGQRLHVARPIPTQTGRW